MTEEFIGRDSGKRYCIEVELGSGGQGTVYLVKDKANGSHYAAKWYKPTGREAQQQHQIEELVRRGEPFIDDPGITFYWPIECLSFAGSKGFGYLMKVFDQNKLCKFNQICLGHVKQPKLPVLCRIGHRLAAALEVLHASGYAYCDINQDNIIIDPIKGEIGMIDNDNVVVNNSTVDVRGVWEFMAPEVSLGKTMPNAESDLYSASVLLYYLWMWEHPMDGKETMKLYSWDIPAKQKYFAREPLFVFHPTNDANTAFGVQGLELHVTRWQRLCPPKLKTMFTETFTEAVHYPVRRKRLNEWRRLFLEMESNAPVCRCGAVNVWDGASKSLTCWKCEKEIALGLCLDVRHAHHGNSVQLAYPGASLRRHHLDVGRFSADSTNVEATVEPHPNEPGHLIVRNQTAHTWGYRAPDGTILDLEPGKARALMAGVELHIGPKTVKVRVA